MSKIAFYEKCNKCGINGFKILDEENDMGENAPLAKWRKFEYVIIGVKRN